MYNYEFDKSELVKKEITSAAIDINEKRQLVNILVTTNKIMFFYDLSLKKPLRSKIQELPQYELLISIPLKDPNMKKHLTGEDTYIEYKDNRIIIYNYDLLNAI